MSWRLRLFAISLLVGAACRDSAIAPPTSRALSIVKADGDAQRDTVLATPAPLRVFVGDDGAPAIGVPVYWTIALDTNTTTSIATTDGSGIAALALTFGLKPAVYTVSAALVRGASAPAVTFTLVATRATRARCARCRGRTRATS